MADERAGGPDGPGERSPPVCACASGAKKMAAVQRTAADVRNSATRRSIRRSGSALRRVGDRDVARTTAAV